MVSVDAVGVRVGGGVDAAGVVNGVAGTDDAAAGFEALCVCDGGAAEHAAMANADKTTRADRRITFL